MARRPSTGPAAARRTGALAALLLAAACTDVIPRPEIHRADGGGATPTGGDVCLASPDPTQPAAPPPPDFLPSDVPGLRAWLRADVAALRDLAGTAPASDGDPVMLWGGPTHATAALQPDPARAPRLRAAALHGRPAVCFDGHQSLAFAHPITLGDHTLFVVTRPAARPRSTNVLLGARASYLLAFDVAADAGSARIAWWSGTTAALSPPIPAATWAVVESDRADSTWYARLDGEDLSGGSAVTDEPQQLASFGDHQGGLDYEGCVAEAIVYDRHLDPDERDAVRGYLAARFGLAGVAPAGLLFARGPRGAYNMTPATVALADGDPAAGRPPTLVTAFRNGPMHTARGEVLVMRSGDGGATWSAPVVAARDPDNDVRTNVGLARLASGTLLLPVEEESAHPSWGLPFTVVGTLLTRSGDGGASWSALEPVATPPGYDWFYAYGALVERADGTLLLPGYGERSVDHGADALLLASRDGGASFSLRGVIAAGDAERAFSETAIAFHGDTLVAVIREENGYGLWLSRSRDGGATFSLPERFDFGTSPALLPLSDGRLLLAYGLRTGVPGVYARMAAFDWLGGLDADRMRAAAAYPIRVTGRYAVGLGYPAPVELPGGRIFVDFYSERLGLDVCRSHIWSRLFDLASLGDN